MKSISGWSSLSLVVASGLVLAACAADAELGSGDDDAEDGAGRAEAALPIVESTDPEVTEASQIDSSPSSVPDAPSTTCAARLERYPVNGPHNGGSDANALTFACAPHPSYAPDNSDYYTYATPSHPDGHFGNDIFGARGTPIVAARAGTVAYVHNDSTGGLNVGVVDSCGWTYYYAHLDSVDPAIYAGRSIAAGTRIGALGNTGNASSTAPHLHFSIYPDGVYQRGIDPFPLLETVDATACSTAASCDRGAFPSDRWNTCLFTGQNPDAATFVRSGYWTDINQDFGSGGPPGVAADHFSYEWRRKVSFPAGRYVFHAIADDGVRLDVGANGSLEINDWSLHAARQVDSAPIDLSGDQLLAARYFESTGSATVRIWWDRVDAGCNRSLFPADRWNTCLFTGVDPDAATFVRSGTWYDINQDFGAGGPSGVPADHFSYEWRRLVSFPAGGYVFHAIADDGVLLDVDADGRLEINDWGVHGPRQVDSGVIDLSGDRLVAARYFEYTGNASVRIWWDRVR